MEEVSISESWSMPCWLSAGTEDTEWHCLTAGERWPSNRRRYLWSYLEVFE